MNKYEILEILYDWNFWERSQFLGVKRKELLKTLSKLSSENFIISIIGPRRSGKSVLIRQFANELIVKGTDSRDILIVNFEDYKWKDLNLDALDKIYSVYLENISISDKPYIFLDEVQRISGWERFVRALLEKRKGHIFVSSSNSKILNKELATSLTGRNLTMEVFPLSFVEFLKFKKIIISEKLDIIAHRVEIARFFEEYLEWGGFPEVSLSKNKKLILQQYFEDILSKDISERYKVRRKDKLETLAKFYLSNISGKITFRKVENFLKISLATIERFSGYLSEAYL
ncbi:MAG: ATP-binding protein, partial [Actinomycetia bacterium]|nr:ATP-binding protein [Actinomycetes bacterium]